MTIEATPDGTHGARLPGFRLLRVFFEPLARMQINAYQRSGDAAVSRRMGFPVVLLTTTGARTGLPRTAVLGGFPDGEDAWLVVASNGGSRHHPSWFINMVKHPDRIWLEVGSRKLRVVGQSLTGQAREDALRRIAAISARYGGYQRRTDRQIPIVRLTPAG